MKIENNQNSVSLRINKGGTPNFSVQLLMCSSDLPPDPASRLLLETKNTNKKRQGRGKKGDIPGPKVDLKSLPETLNLFLI